MKDHLKDMMIGKGSSSSVSNRNPSTLYRCIYPRTFPCWSSPPLDCGLSTCQLVMRSQPLAASAANSTAATGWEKSGLAWRQLQPAWQPLIKKPPLKIRTKQLHKLLLSAYPRTGQRSRAANDVAHVAWAAISEETQQQRRRFKEAGQQSRKRRKRMRRRRRMLREEGEQR